MPTTVRLDAGTLRLMHRLVRRTGRTKSEIIRDAIRRLGEGEEAAAAPKTAYDAMEHAIGCWDSGGARLSEQTGRRFRALLIARRESVGARKRTKRARTS
jgi:Arc/MetJ-type ribon-helix-helix transcriptional regulator